MACNLGKDNEILLSDKWARGFWLFDSAIGLLLARVLGLDICLLD